MKTFVSFILFLTLMSQSFAACFPQNNLSIPTSLKSINGISEEQFFQVVKDLNGIYLPIFEKDYNAKLSISAKWEDATVNAYAQQSGKTWQVAMFGGLARHEETTVDGFAAVLCHEIGHHIAGATRKPSMLGNTWASNEGQSDYYATTKCLKKYYKLEKHLAETIKKYLNISSFLNEEDTFAKNKCEEVYAGLEERAVCFRSALAGKSLARLLGSLRNNPEVFFSKPDPKIATATNHNHPEAQCRMDTYFQGALCVNDEDELADPSDVRKAYCTAIEKFTIGLRPACWYKASEYEK
jgi:hypothetical protein